MGMEACLFAHPSCWFAPSCSLPKSQSCGIFKGSSRCDPVSGALLPARFQQQSRAQSPFKSPEGNFQSCRGGQGVPAPAAPGGPSRGAGSWHKGLRVLFSRGAPGNPLCIQEVSVPFLSLACHKNQHFLRRKGAHGAEELGEEGTEIPPGPVPAAGQP